MSAHSWLDSLNDAQREAATHEEGPLLVIAGAGSGKTRTVACRVAWLLGRGVAPEQILLLTFTRRAAAEMLERAGHLAGSVSTSRVWGGTFHAVANRLLRQYGRALGLSPEFTVVDQSDAADLMHLIRCELQLGEGRKRFPQKGTLIAVYSRMVNSRTMLSEVVEKHFPWCRDATDGMRQVFEEYTRRKRRQQLLDYDDLLLFWRALGEVPALQRTLGSMFAHVLVDEYQDTNLIQAEILQAMRRDNHNVMVVGDDAQAIYSFRAATVRNILDFPQQFPGTRVVTLAQNYRSTQPILDASNAVMAGARTRYAKDLFTARGGVEKPLLVSCRDESEQAVAVCERVLARREEGIALREQAVLFRAGHLSDGLEVELNRRNIPFVKYGGLKFVEAAHVKDLLSLLRLLENPADELSWFRILQLLDGVGPVVARRIVNALLTGNGAADASGARLEAEGDDAETSGEHREPAIRGQDGSPSALDRSRPSGTVLSPHRVLIDCPPEVPAAAREAFQALREAVADCVGCRLVPEGDGAPSVPLPPGATVERLRRFYEPIFQRVYDNPLVRLRDLDQLQQIAEGYTSRSQFLSDLTLDPPQSTQDLAGPPLLDEDYLILSTIHSAKGCEWDAVHVLSVADGILPSDMATGSADEIEEERRLLYVAMTRARDHLTLYFPLRYYQAQRGFSDRHTYGQLSRFLTGSILMHLDQTRAMAAPTAIGPAADVPEGGSASVDALLSQLLGT